MTRPPSLGPVSFRTDQVVRIGPLTLRIASDVPGFPALRYFSRAARMPAATAADTELWCLSHADPGLPADTTARSLGFASGYYVTDHFGPPVRISSSGNRIVLVGEHLERLVWPYIVKYLLLRHTATAGGVFLKAAALAAGNGATLIVGRGGGGKSVLLTGLCRGGATFITNSHVVLDGRAVRGVASTMRMRPGPWLDQTASTAALDPGERLVDPYTAFPHHTGAAVPLRAVWIADFRAPGEHDVHRLPPDEAIGIVDQFALGLNVYRLEEDLLDLYGGDYRAFSTRYGQMRAQLHAAVTNYPTYRVRSDVQHTANRDRLLQLLRDGGTP
ncbi:hypothetical protein [Streptomyces acidiscabies]|uniref:HPr kinase/phosphorylase n=1 Tax=Streptomyces acidiscabies TaxID=42234 RepID=A0ABU4MEY4_9ACTN|nr:hypothetical protein [Streptomyces acidiscabies]MDX3025792.1 hypothetical protein [Streptomyces acidiscabies]